MYVPLRVPYLWRVFSSELKVEYVVEVIFLMFKNFSSVLFPFIETQKSPSLNTFPFIWYGPSSVLISLWKTETFKYGTIRLSASRLSKGRRRRNNGSRVLLGIRFSQIKPHRRLPQGTIVPKTEWILYERRE